MGAWLSAGLLFHKYCMDEVQEQNILEELHRNSIWYELKCQRYSGQNQYHNVYDIGYNASHIFGEIEFGKNPIWRISWYKDGKLYRDSGYIYNSFDKLKDIIVNLSLPGIKNQMIDERKADFAKDFE